MPATEPLSKFSEPSENRCSPPQWLCGNVDNFILVLATNACLSLNCEGIDLLLKSACRMRRLPELKIAYKIGNRSCRAHDDDNDTKKKEWVKTLLFNYESRLTYGGQFILRAEL